MADTSVVAVDKNSSGGRDENSGSPAAGAGAEDSGKHSGRVKWFSNARGFGFITPDDGGEDLFVHQAAIHAEGFRSLCENESVEYVVEQGEDGRARAVHVTGPDGSYVQGSTYRSRHNSTRSAGGARRGPNNNNNSCFTCGEPGHLARDCTASGGAPAKRSGGDSVNCFNCGQPGHFARDCSSSAAAAAADPPSASA